MKILFFVHSFPSLSETFVLNQVTAMLDKGHDVRVFGWGDSDSQVHEDYERYNLQSITWHRERKIPQSHIKRGLGISGFLIRRIFSHGFKSLKLLSGKYGKFAKNLTLSYIAERYAKSVWKPDVIISHFGDNAQMISAMTDAGVIDRNIRRYAFFHAHEICRQSVEQLAVEYKPIFCSDDKLLPISFYWRDKMIKAGANPDNIMVFHMGVDLSKFKYRNNCKIGDTVNILSVGRLVGQKGYKYSIEGIANFKEKSGRKVKYRIIGKGEEETGLKKIVHKLKLEDVVEFLGGRTQEEVKDVMNKADIFLLPSVTDNLGYMEGIPVALMEAMAIGVPVISTYHSGIPELIDNGISGYLCGERNIEDISDAIKRIVEAKDEERIALTQKAREKIEDEYNMEILQDNLDMLIR